MGSDAWNRFWFAPADPITLGLMRLLVGSMLVYTHLVWGIDFESFVGDAGWNGEQLVREYQSGSLAPSFWWYVEPGWYHVVHWVSILVLALFTIGFATRITSVLSMIVVVSYSYKAVLSNYGLDQINSILTFYLCIGPSGAALSVDRMISNRRRAGSWFAATPREKSAFTTMALRLVQLHFCVIYTYAGLSKLQGNAWWNGEAVWMAFANSEYQTIDMTWIAWYPWISDLMTHTTIIWEVSFWALVWTRLRPAVLVIGAALHIGIGAAMGMWTFGLIMIYGHLAFWPAESTLSLIHYLRIVPRAALSLCLAPLVRKNTVGGPAPALVSPVSVAGSRRENRRARQTGRSGVLRSGTMSGQPPTPGTKILIVGRSPSILRTAGDYFARHGYESFAASTIQSSIELAEVHNPEVILLIGRGIRARATAEFCQACLSDENQQLYLILSKAQVERLADILDDTRIHVFVGGARLGKIRHAIEAREKHVAVATAPRETNTFGNYQRGSVNLKPR